MPAYIKKSTSDITREALRKLVDQTAITATSPGSFARALTEAMTTEMGDLYDIMDFNMNQSLLSTATGSALDQFGLLYNTPRKTISNIAQIDRETGSFRFELSTAVLFDVTIPAGTNIYTDADTYIGRQFSYSTVADVRIPAGRTRGYASIRPNYTDSVYTAGVGTLRIHDYAAPVGVTVLCTNDKAISAQVGYEDDDAYRVRLIKSLRVNTAGTAEAVRFSTLGVSGVRDVKIRQAPYGMGSFEAIVVPEQNGNAAQIMRNASVAATAVRPLGVRMYIKSPVTKPIDIEVDLIMPGANSVNASEAAAKRAQVGILRYINALLPGTPLVYNRLIAIILDSSDLVKDVIVKKLALNGQELLRRNYQPADDEQITPGAITVSVAQA